MDRTTPLGRTRNIETRRLQLTGGATLIVSLPKEWARQVGLKPGDEVVIVQQVDGSLLVIPRKILRSPVLEARLGLTRDLLSNFSKVERLLISYYLSGAEVIKLDLTEENSEIRKRLKRFIRDRLTGLEVIEESRSQLVIQDLVDLSNTDIRALMLNMVKVVANMMSDLCTGIEKEDLEILRDVIERDVEIDRFYLFIRRILKKMLTTSRTCSDSLSDPRVAIEYSLLSKSIERIADNVSEIAEEVLKGLRNKSLRLSLDLKSTIIDIVQEEQRLLEILSGYLLISLPDPRYLNKLADFTCNDINSRIEMLINRLHSSNGDDTPITPTVRLILYNLLRIAEYITDIAEALLDLAITRSIRGTF